MKFSPRVDTAGRRPQIVVLGNEKGGSGKSTTAMHLIVGLLRAEASVGSIDLDARQGTLTRYVENRRASASELPLALWRHIPIEASRNDSAVVAAAEDRAHLTRALADLADCDFSLGAWNAAPDAPLPPPPFPSSSTISYWRASRIQHGKNWRHYTQFASETELRIIAPHFHDIWCRDDSRSV